VKGLPLKILRHFEAEDEWLLEPGDMLYLPPLWAHEGVAVGPCLTASVGFRAPARHDLVRELLARLGDGLEAANTPTLYADAGQPATASPAEIPTALQAFAAKAVSRALQQPGALACALGESLTEPKAQVWFQASSQCDMSRGFELQRGTRMMYDAAHVYVNGESFAVSGRDGRLMRRLADRRVLTAKEAAQLGVSARECVVEWLQAGWLRGADA
jgi:50S ribosomal protein L16 3-hydroxylase